MERFGRTSGAQGPSHPVKDEKDLIKKIEVIASRGAEIPGLLTGIGDDCAVYSLGPDRYGLFTTDISIENQHFLLSKSTPRDIGYKAMVSNISDISAMGGHPLLAFVSLGIPEAMSEESVLGLYEGMTAAASSCGCAISGGDLSKSEVLVLNIALYGEKNGESPLKRSGARPGDSIFVTGTLGSSMAGLDVILERTAFSPMIHPVLLDRHNCPPVRSGMVENILNTFKPTSMIDISDGLLSDLGHICCSSKTGFVIEAESIPVLPELTAHCRNIHADPAVYALNSGEEYELLFTSNEKDAQAEGISRIGTVTETGYILLKDGNKIEVVNPRGFDHFRKG